MGHTEKGPRADADRDRGTCPVCGGRYGRQERVLQDGDEALIYWHTDLSDHKEYCIETCTGEKRTISHGPKTGARAADSD